MTSRGAFRAAGGRRVSDWVNIGAACANATVEMTSGRAFRAPQAKHACTDKTHEGIRALCVQVCVPCGVYDWHL